MSYKSFYRNIHKTSKGFEIKKGNEKFGTYSTIEDALYERDRLIAVGWDWDLAMELPETPNGYIHIDLPPFEHESSYISEDKEHWVVRDRGKFQKYRGTYYNYDEARRVALIYDGTISHKKSAFRIQKRVDGKTTYFGRFRTREDAEKRVEELKKNDWVK